MPDQTSNRLKRNTPEILLRWEKRTWAEVKASNNQESLALRDSLPEYLSKLAQALSGTLVRTDDSRLQDKIDITRIGRQHGHDRALSLNYTIDQLIMEYHLLRQVICDVMDSEKELTLAERELITCSIEQAVNDAASELNEIVKETTSIATREEELRRSIKTKDDFLSIVSHELKTPLTSLQLKSEMIIKQINKNGGKTTQNVGEFAEYVRKHVSRIAHLVEDILDFGRIRTGSYKLEFKQRNICEVIQEVIHQVDHAYQWFRLSPPDVACSEDALVKIDEDRIKQAMINLFTNALRFGKGRPVQVEIHVHDSEIEVTVSDKGIGIEEKNFDRIFNMFERAITPSEVSGLGLGLYMTREIIEAHGGRIWVESQYGAGSSFHFVLPRDNSSLSK